MLTAVGIGSVTLGVALWVSIAASFIIFGVLVLALGIALALSTSVPAEEHVELHELVVDEHGVELGTDAHVLEENPIVADPLQRFRVVGDAPR